MHYCGQAQHLVTPGVGVGESVLGTVAGRSAVLPRGVPCVGVLLVRRVEGNRKKLTGKERKGKRREWKRKREI